MGQFRVSAVLTIVLTILATFLVAGLVLWFFPSIARDLCAGQVATMQQTQSSSDLDTPLRSATITVVRGEDCDGALVLADAHSGLFWVQTSVGERALLAVEPGYLATNVPATVCQRQASGQWQKVFTIKRMLH